MVQNTETVPITETSKTISVSIQISYQQVLDLALQLTKEGKEKTPTTEDNNDFQFSTNTPNKLKSGESNPQPLTEEQIQQLQETNKEAWKDDDKTDEEWEQLMEKHL